MGIAGVLHGIFGAKGPRGGSDISGMAKSNAQPAQAPESGGNSSSPHQNLKAAAAPAGKPHRLRLNRAQQEALELTEVICRCAQKAAYAPTLASHGISAAFVTQLLTDATATRTDTTDAVVNTGDGEAATAGQSTKKQALIRRLRRIQAAAKQKYLYVDPQRLADFLVGQPIGQSRAFLLQASETIISAGHNQGLPGIDTNFIVASTADRTQYVDAKQPQLDKKAQAQQARAEVKAFVESVSQRRRQIQLAVDSAWPPGVPENVEVRKLFRIPLDRSPSL